MPPARESERVVPRILHVSADYPNPAQGPDHHRDRTSGKKGGVGEHVVMSLNRTILPWKTYFIDCGQVDGVHLLPTAISDFQWAWGSRPPCAASRERSRGCLRNSVWRPDLVHAHKFAFEGIAGLWLAEHFGPETRFFVSVRGESERNVFLRKPGYRGLMRRIAERADMIYHVSAWFRSAYHDYLARSARQGAAAAQYRGQYRRRTFPRSPPEPRFATVLHLDQRKRKGLSDLLRGFADFLKSNPGVGLDIIGPGDARDVAAVTKRNRRTRTVRRRPPAGRHGRQDAFCPALPHYLALALPSHQETFGMVYLEALFAGIPILYSRDTGIDGYLDGIQAGVSVQAGNVAEISQALSELAGTTRLTGRP